MICSKDSIVALIQELFVKSGKLKAMLLSSPKMEYARSCESLFSYVEMEEDEVILGQPLPAEDAEEEIIGSSQETIAYWSLAQPKSPTPDPSRAWSQRSLAEVDSEVVEDIGSSQETIAYWSLAQPESPTPGPSQAWSQRSIADVDSDVDESEVVVVEHIGSSQETIAYWSLAQPESPTPGPSRAWSQRSPVEEVIEISSDEEEEEEPVIQSARSACRVIYTAAQIATKPYVCSYDGCGVRFTRDYSRTVYERKYHGVVKYTAAQIVAKPFVYSFNGCGVRFTWKANQMIHERHIWHFPQ
jgi:hypothetical protein